MRKLASVQRVLDIQSIDGADFIEAAQINGWQCVVKKGEFAVGDLAVYFEIDAVPPANDAFSFLWRPLAAPSPSFRIRTKKLKGVISQGLLLPLNLLPETEDLGGVVHEDMDVTALLGVTKYEPPVRGIGGSPPAGAFAADVPKTDEDRLQSNMRVLDELRGLPYVITEKCDETSATFAIDRDGVFRVYGRNYEVADGDNPCWNVARLHGIEAALRDGNEDLALQGEVCGPGIQSNKLGLGRHELRAFNLFDKSTGEHDGPDDLIDFCVMHRIPRCKEVERGDSFDHTKDSLLVLAEGKYDGTKNEREGIVIRPQTPVFSKTLRTRLSFKVISNRFLLKGGDE